MQISYERLYFQASNGLNTASNGFMKASNMYAAPMKVTFQGLSHMAVNDLRGYVLEGSEGGIQKGSRGVPGGV